MGKSQWERGVRSGSFSGKSGANYHHDGDHIQLGLRDLARRPFCRDRSCRRERCHRRTKILKTEWRQITKTGAPPQQDSGKSLAKSVIYRNELKLETKANDMKTFTGSSQKVKTATMERARANRVFGCKEDAAQECANTCRCSRRRGGK